MAKTFRTAPRPPAPSAEAMAAYVRSGAGKDRLADHLPDAAPERVEKAAMARMSVDLPETLHRRYKAACVRAGLKMSADVIAWIEQRTAELEKQTHSGT